MRIAIVCLGSQGDVRPFVALGTGLRRDGHEVVILTNSSNEQLCIENGFSFVPLAGDLPALIDAMQPGKLGKIQFIKVLLQIIQGAISEQFETLKTHLQNVDGVLFHPVVFSAEHVIEALGLPSVRIHFQPNSRSKHYANCLFPPKMPFQRLANLASHFLAAQFAWLPLRGIINRWRTNPLGLSKLGILAPLSHEPFRRIPNVIAVSKTVVPPAPDWPNNVHVTGYLQLNKAADWTPPGTLQQFLEQGPPPVYIGFGSLTGRCNPKMSQAIVYTMKQSPHRFILSGPFAHIDKSQLPPNVLSIEGAPHDWLFPKMAAIVHHGGAGTTHAALSACKAALLVPFICDQFHWGEAISRNGLGPKPLTARQFTQKSFQKSLEDLLATQSYHTQAAAYGAKMKEESGIDQALHFFYQEILTFKNRLQNTTHCH